MKRTVTKLMHVTGAFAPFRMANRDKALILTYHRFSPFDADGRTSACAFEEQVQYLTSHYRIVPLFELAEYMEFGISLPPGIASITIDDGYEDAYQIAFPILKKYKAPATLFVVSSFIDRAAWLWTDKLRFIASLVTTGELRGAVLNRIPQLNLELPTSRSDIANEVNEQLKKMPDDLREKHISQLASLLGIAVPDFPPDEFGPITWTHAREMADAGVHIGSHTATHPILTRIDDQRLSAELNDSRSRIEGILGRKVNAFCYPNGDYDKRISSAVRDAGYSCAVTVEPGLNGSGADVFTLKRVHSDNNFARFNQYTSGFEQFKNRFMHAGRGAL